jgi:hypothetical protein
MKVSPSLSRSATGNEDAGVSRPFSKKSSSTVFAAAPEE